MSIVVESCPHLCARQGVTRRHELPITTVLARAARLLVVFIRCYLGIRARLVLDMVTRGQRSARYARRAYASVIAASGLRVEVSGVRETLADDAEPVLVVANHVSWLDVMALASVHPVTMVSKLEIRDWPIIGAVARATGTIFIDRFRLREVAQIRKTVASTLRAGQVVATFPEATTTCGRGLGRLYPAMFQAAIDVGVPVQPVALSFRDSTGTLTTAGAYVGEQPLLDSIFTIIRQRDLTLHVEILPRIMPKHVRPIDDRRALRDASAEAIATALQPAVGDYDAHLRPMTCQAHQLPLPVIDDPLAELASEVPPVVAAS